jgi:hypothetical protein
MERCEEEESSLEPEKKGQEIFGDRAEPRLLAN